ncbi:chemotaxis-specific methylesterase [bacterium BMS3Abin07]|nr:chemotaxis-specific methylesterase [bacterium BMS3Abin07]GBE32031.1 chemotaxis-specific methylesterase [bacterium BMS3Bbin05]HDL20621.1 response regulator [Nitrospirota bacterium]HDO22297.1 response regulator [Nitrospirota bacterium]HDZ88716.1 response regulator [Nitrospirota bacterium]
MDKTKYCLCCGEDVPFHTVVRNERHEITCSFCGFPLEVDKARSESDRENEVAFVAEDSDIVRNIIVEMLKKNKSVNRVIPCKNGVELLKAISDTYKEIFIDKKAINTNFAIIDLNMPLMDGLTAARSIRSMEKNNNISKIPIVFFSSIIANEKIRSILDTLAPAVYINKGNIPDKNSLIRRVDTLLKYLSEKYAGSDN